MNVNLGGAGKWRDRQLFFGHATGQSLE